MSWNAEQFQSHRFQSNRGFMSPSEFMAQAAARGPYPGLALSFLRRKRQLTDAPDLGGLSIGEVLGGGDVKAAYAAAAAASPPEEKKEVKKSEVTEERKFRSLPSVPAPQPPRTIGSIHPATPTQRTVASLRTPVQEALRKAKEKGEPLAPRPQRRAAQKDLHPGSTLYR